MGDAAAGNVDAPTVVLVLDQGRMGIHHQLAQFSLRRNLIYYGKALALVANHQLGILMTEHADINQFVVVQLQGEAVVVVITYKFVAILIYLVMSHLQFIVYLVALAVVEREADVWNLNIERERISLFWNQGEAQAFVTEVLLLADEAVIGLLRLFYLHVAMAAIRYQK